MIIYRRNIHKYDSTNIVEVLANILSCIPSKCEMPDCHEPSVRLGIYENEEYIEFRNLCERHKRIGMWNNNGGWDIE